MKPKIDHLLGRRVLLETEGSDAVLEKIDLASAIGHGRVMKEGAASQNKSKIVPAQTLPKTVPTKLQILEVVHNGCQMSKLIQ